jgi:hypothetical protein
MVQQRRDDEKQEHCFFHAAETSTGTAATTNPA